jgi:transposase
MRSVTSVLTVRTNRSAKQFALGHCGGLFTVSMPAPAKTASNGRDHRDSKLAARRHVGQLLDIKPATLRNWIEADERAARPAGTGRTDSADDAAELRRLRQEVAELRRANEILKTASAFFAQAELDRRLK